MVGTLRVDILGPIFEKAILRFCFENESDFSFGGQITAEIKEKFWKKAYSKEGHKIPMIKEPPTEFSADSEHFLQKYVEIYFWGQRPLFGVLGTSFPKKNLKIGKKGAFQL